MAHHSKHFGNDTFADSGVWGRPTSAANFCEEDYVVTRYIAEFINALTNVAYVYMAFHCLRRARPSTPLYARFDFMSISLIIVGFTSFAYHVTLRQTLQFADDLSMLVLAGSLIQPLYVAHQTHLMRHFITAALMLGISLMSVIYVRSGNILIHFTTFSSLLMMVWPRTLYLVYCKQRSQEEIRYLMSTFGQAVSVLVVGFVIWNIDLEMCLDLRSLKNLVGMPLSWGLELHGWWHVLTALGASRYIRLIHELTTDENKSKIDTERGHDLKHGPNSTY